MTLKEQRRWLTTRQRWAKQRLYDASVMVIGQGEKEQAHKDLVVTTALLETLDSLEDRQLSLYNARRTP